MTRPSLPIRSPLVAFTLGERPDDAGRQLTAIQSWDDTRLEAVHDYIQWLFPLPERSAFNPDAPLLSAADIKAFQDSAELRGRLLASFRRMLAFYGLALDESAHEPRVTPAPDFPRQAGNWLRPGNHNLLRLTRILRCLTLLGLSEHARALLACLEALDSEHPGQIGATTLRYWRGAVHEI